MADLSTGGGGGGGAAYTYVQDSQPSNPEEGESWYDTGSNAAYVFDGAAWIEQTVVDHASLSGVGSSDHHSKPTGTQNNGTSRNRTVSYSATVSAGGSKTISTDGHPAVIDLHHSGTSGDFDWTINFADGSTASAQDFADVKPQTVKHVTSVVANSSSSFSRDAYVRFKDRTGIHNHSI